MLLIYLISNTDIMNITAFLFFFLPGPYVFCLDVVFGAESEISYNFCKSKKSIFTVAIS